MSNLENALKFLENIDALKTTYRKCLVMNGDKYESTAEHSYSLAMAVLAMCQFANQKIDLMKTLKMALFHDLAEALMGDTFHYDKKSTTAHDEAVALKKVLQPIGETDLADEIYNLWNEFESGDSHEAIFLRGVDRFLPMYHNFKTKGHTWVKHGITKVMALEKNAHIQQSSEVLWQFTRQMLDQAQKNSWLG